MDYLPLTRSAAFTEFPAGGNMETLFPELAPPGLEQFELTVTVDGRDFPAMDVIAAEADMLDAFRMAWRACRDLGDFEVRVRPLR